MFQTNDLQVNRNIFKIEFLGIESTNFPPNMNTIPLIQLISLIPTRPKILDFSWNKTIPTPNDNQNNFYTPNSTRTATTKFPRPYLNIQDSYTPNFSLPPKLNISGRGGDKKGLPSRFSPIIAGKFSQRRIRWKGGGHVTKEYQEFPPWNLAHDTTGTTLFLGKLSLYLNFKLLTRRPRVIRDREREGERERERERGRIVESREKIPGTKLRRIVGIETQAWIHIGWEYFVGIPPTSIESLFVLNTGVTWALKFVSYFADTRTEQSYRREKFSEHRLSFLVYSLLLRIYYIQDGGRGFYILFFLLLFWFNFF